MAPSASTKVGHALAKVLGIKLHYRDPTGGDKLTRGESVFSVSSADAFIEDEPTAAEWLRGITPSGKGLLRWAYDLFPFTHWIGRYNGQWLFGDLIAGQYSDYFAHSIGDMVDKCASGITVGCVVVPQSMAYAKLAQLPPQFGLYSSFMGVLIYWFFATSKDITIGVSWLALFFHVTVLTL